MTQYGKIISYDAENGAGKIAPQDGSEALSFRKADLQQQGEEPRSDQLYTFETQRGPDGQPQAVNVQMEQGPNARQTDSDHGTFNDQGQSEQAANQENARRSGVDGAGLQQGDRDHRIDNERQSQSQTEREHQIRTEGQEGVSRGGLETARGDAPGENRADQRGTSTGGSTFQPLEADESKDQRSVSRQHELGRDAEGRDERDR